MKTPKLDLTLDPDQDHSILIDRLPEPLTFYPVILESTERRVVWVMAEDQVDAYRQMRDQPYGLWEDADPIDDGASLVAVAPAKLPGDPWWTTPDPDAYRDVREIEVGPVEGCLECGARASEPTAYHWKWIRHDPSCSRHSHSVDYSLAYTRDGEGRERLVEPRLWALRCSCKAPGWDVPYSAVIEDGVSAVLPEEAARRAQEHVAGRLHSKHLPLGVTENLDPGDRSYSRLVTS